MNEKVFLEAISTNPNDDLARLIYADWLEERGDVRHEFVRLHLALRATAPDHVHRMQGEQELSLLRMACDPSWLATVEPERVPPPDDPTEGRGCHCFDAGYENRKWPSMYLHTEVQDTECDAWKYLLEAVEKAAVDGREEFAPLREMSLHDRAKIVTLPPTIAKLKSVKTLHLYGSCLVRLPPEIGEMSLLERFVPYTSYRLHWFPFEITRCRNLKSSTVSTRALYGNNKYHPPFPKLGLDSQAIPGRPEPERLPLRLGQHDTTRPCSVCRRPFEDRRLHRAWISLPVATDVLPLLVNACSAECLTRLPKPPERYLQGPHLGGHNARRIRHPGEVG